METETPIRNPSCLSVHHHLYGTERANVVEDCRKFESRGWLKVEHLQINPSIIIIVHQRSRRAKELNPNRGDLAGAWSFRRKTTRSSGQLAPASVLFDGWFYVCRRILVFAKHFLNFVLFFLIFRPPRRSWTPRSLCHIIIGEVGRIDPFAIYYKIFCWGTR